MADKELLGEWVNTSPYDDKGECSRCCYVSKKYYNFCPNCGVRIERRTYSLSHEERPQDSWIYNDGSYMCSKCGHEIIGILQDLNYCCKCGAKMRGVIESDIKNGSEEK